MPLEGGSSAKTISSNIAEVLRSAKKKKSIGNIPTKGKSKKKVRQIAAAIAYRKARE